MCLFEGSFDLSFRNCFFFVRILFVINRLIGVLFKESRACVIFRLYIRLWILGVYGVIKVKWFRGGFVVC